MPADRAIHSDFLIHWTGKDVDRDFDPDWAKHPKGWSVAEGIVAEKYVERLANILKYGLWMTVEPACTYGSIVLPDTPKCCFTELRLSESRRHAENYGRLGIGVKRPFLIQRMGRPLAYFGFGPSSQDVLLKACARDLQDNRLLHFFKPMNSDGGKLIYDYYGESEWRILLFEELISSGKIIDPRDPRNSEHHSYFNSLSPAEQGYLKYLIPLDGWFSMVIYPSISIKNFSQALHSSNVPDLIKAIKTRQDHGNAVEKGNWPIELNLDACLHF